MKHVLVTGASGFVGRNLVVALQRREDVALTPFDVDDEPGILAAALEQADIIYHLAGVNRPKTEEEFEAGNAGSTRAIVDVLEAKGRSPMVVLSSSIQAERDNPYGKSKKAAEDALLGFHQRTDAPVCIYRFPHLFGKWSRPNYNTVVATFCYNIARGLDITISDPTHELELAYIDDVVDALLGHLDTAPSPNEQIYSVGCTFRVTLGELADRIRSLRDIRETLQVPDLSDPLMICLHATYLSFLPEDAFSYPAQLKTDDRGWLFELIKSTHFGQVFVSKTHPGITRGNHYHDTKLEKFCVIQGDGIIRFRRVDSGSILEYPVNDREIKVVDIPPGYTHSIENTGDQEMICLFWANQVFDPDLPDTHYIPVSPS